MDAQIDFPTATATDPSDVVIALQTAQALWRSGDAKDALRWIRRAAEAAEVGGDDMRAVTLARAAADLQDLLPATPSNAPSQMPAATASRPAPQMPAPAPAVPPAPQASAERFEIATPPPSQMPMPFASAPPPPQMPAPPPAFAEPPDAPPRRPSVSAHPMQAIGAPARNADGVSAAPEPPTIAQEPRAEPAPAPAIEVAPPQAAMETPRAVERPAPAADELATQAIDGEPPALRDENARVASNGAFAARPALRVSVEVLSRASGTFLVRMLGEGEELPARAYEALLVPLEHGVDLRDA